MVKCHFSRLSASLQAVKLFFRTEGLTAEFKAEFKLRTIAWASVRYKSFRLSRRRTGASGAESVPGNESGKMLIYWSKDNNAWY